MAKMLGRSRYRVQCCRWDDYGSKPSNRKLFRRMTRKTDARKWRREEGV